MLLEIRIRNRLRGEKSREYLRKMRMNFGFSYFSNIHILSAIFNKDMSSGGEIIKRVDFISNMIFEYLIKRSIN